MTLTSAGASSGATFILLSPQLLHRLLVMPGRPLLEGYVKSFSSRATASLQAGLWHGWMGVLETLWPQGRLNGGNGQGWVGGGVVKLWVSDLNRAIPFSEHPSQTHLPPN